MLMTPKLDPKITEERKVRIECEIEWGRVREREREAVADKCDRHDILFRHKLDEMEFLSKQL